MPAETLVLLGGCFVAAFASGMAGFSFNLIAAGILYHWLPPQQTAPVMVIASLLIQGATVGVVWRSMRWAAIRPYVIGGALGTPFGVIILRHADPTAIVAGVGVLLVGYASYTLARMALRLSPRSLRAGAGADAGVGFAGGVLGGIGGFSGALPAMWTDLKGLRKDEARAVLQPFIIAMQVVAAVSLFAGGFFTRDSATMLLIATPALLLGTLLGIRAYKVITPEGFRVVLLVLLLLSGVSLIL